MFNILDILYINHYSNRLYLPQNLMKTFFKRLRVIGLLSIIALLVTIAHSAMVNVPAEIVQAQSGFSVTVTDGKSEVQAGGSLVYKINIDTDADEAESVDVEFYLPEQVTVLSASENGRKLTNQILWRDVLVFPGRTKTLTVNVEVHPRVQAGTPLTAGVEVLGLRVGDKTVVIDKAVSIAPLRIYIDDNAVYAHPEEPLYYSIIVDNQLGPDRDYTLRTYLPPHLSFVEASGSFYREQRQVVWQKQFILAGERQEYFLTGLVDRDTPDYETLRTKVSSGPAQATDSTTVLYETLPPSTLSLTVNDYQEKARNGENLTYDITINNNEGLLATGVDVKSALPTYMEFVSATEGGYWNGNSVLWEGLTVSPYGKRKLQVTMRVRSDAPLGTVLQQTTSAMGITAVDTTEVAKFSDARKNVSRPTPHRVTLLSKYANRTEVRPGDTVTYTIRVNNTYDHPITNVRVEDRMTGGYASVVNAESGELMGDRIVWTIPSLAPGAEWMTRYTVRIDRNTPHGVYVDNVVSISGEGMETTTLTERVRTTSVGIVSDLPNTGAPLDVLFGGLMSILAGIPPIWQRKKIV